MAVHLAPCAKGYHPVRVGTTAEGAPVQVDSTDRGSAGAHQALEWHNVATTTMLPRVTQWALAIATVGFLGASIYSVLDAPRQQEHEGRELQFWRQNNKLQIRKSSSDTTDSLMKESEGDLVTLYTAVPTLSPTRMPTKAPTKAPQPYHVASAMALGSGLNLNSPTGSSGSGGGNRQNGIQTGSLGINLNTLKVEEEEEVIPQYVYTGSRTVKKTVSQYIATHARFTKIVEAFHVFGLMEGALSHPNGIFTLFAPVNDAFDIFGEAYWQELLKPRFHLHLADLLANQLIVGQKLTIANLTQGFRFSKSTQLGTGPEQVTVKIRPTDGAIQLVNDATRNPDDIILSRPPFKAPVISFNETNLINGVVQETSALTLPMFVHLDVVDGMRRYWNTYSDFLRILDAHGFAAMIRDAGIGTVFAPNNGAWLRFQGDVVEHLMDPAQQSLVQRILVYSVSTSIINFRTVKQTKVIPVLFPERSVTMEISAGGSPTIQGIPAVGFSLYLGGIIYELDGVLLP